MMAKPFKATWLGDGDPSAQVIFLGGLRFIKGDATDVPHDVAVNGVPFADTIRSNPAFSIEDEPDVPEPTDDEVAEMKKTLDGRGVRYRANVSPTKLRELIADTEAAPSEAAAQNAATATQAE